MSAMSWVKLHTDILGDPKLMRAARNGAPDLELLPWLIAFAGRANDDGRLSVGTEPGDERDFADGVPNATPQRMRNLVAVLLRLEILAPDDDGTLAFTAWDRRAGKPSDQPSSVAERVRKHRERKRQGVTPGNAAGALQRNATEEEEEEEGEGEEESSTTARAATAEVLAAFPDPTDRTAVEDFLAKIPAEDQRRAWRGTLMVWLAGHDIRPGVTPSDIASGLRDYLLRPAKDFGGLHVRKYVERAMTHRLEPPARAAPAGGRRPDTAGAEAYAIAHAVATAAHAKVGGSR